MSVIDECGEDERVEMIHVGLLGERDSLSTLQCVDAETEARNLCEALEGKMDLTAEEAQYYTLLLVLSYSLPHTSTFTHYLRTFHPAENICATVASCLASFCNRHQIRPVTMSDDDLSPAPAGFDISGIVAPTETISCLPTLPPNTSLRFFFKSYNLPLELEPGDHSGSDSDDETTEIDLSDLSYIRHAAEKRGFLLKRSKGDPNIWRRRYCVVTDNLYMINVKRHVPAAVIVGLSGSVKLHLETGGLDWLDQNQGRGKHQYQGQMQDNGSQKGQSLDFPFLIALECRGTSQSVSLRAISQEDHGEWCDAMLTKIAQARENDAIRLAEAMIGDDECRKTERSNRTIKSGALDTPRGREVLLGLSTPDSRQQGRPVIIQSGMAMLAGRGIGRSLSNSSRRRSVSVSGQSRKLPSHSRTSNTIRDGGIVGPRKRSSLLELSIVPVSSVISPHQHRQT